MTFSLQEKYQEIVQQLPGYEPRPIQETMAVGIHEALKNKQIRVIEAGTGAGKSFGYLIPLLFHPARPVVISTGTIALQEQLLQKDIPFVMQAAGMPDLNVQLVKGRRNYLCLQKLSEFEKTLSPQAPERLYVSLVKSAFASGWNGDRATLDSEVPREIWDEMQSDSEDCLGRRCGYYEENPYRIARENLAEADILVVNHALYLQDMMAGNAVLPPHDVVVFDEAHHLKNFALSAFTARIGKFATNKLLRKVHRRLCPVPEDYQHAIYQTEAQILQWLFQHDKPTFALQTDETFYRLVQQQIHVLTELRAWLGSFDVKQLQIVTTDFERDRAAIQRQKLLEQLDGLTNRWEFFVDNSDANRVNWAEVNHERLYYEIKSTPLTVSEQLDTALWADKTGILTSATLATHKDLSFFRKHLGIQPGMAAPDMILESPFHFKHQCELYLPLHLPEPNDIRFTEAAIAEIAKILQFTQGRAFVLFTSYAAMQKACAALAPMIPYPCKMQGDLPKNRLVSWFKETPHSVLFATASFWEGIDVPGQSLSCVIMDRIPFTTPDEPVHSATVDRMKRRGEDWFNGYVLPEATIRLKQGFGRLIRTQQDHGIVAILDTRLKTKGYGKKILESLPQTRIITSLSASKLALFQQPETDDLINTISQIAG